MDQIDNRICTVGCSLSFFKNLIDLLLCCVG
uniref:Uncharacterized protein n=1 Tax=Anguilla anguilla TaxID=7936 RepID=A0A0E9PQL9_ANGAN